MTTKNEILDALPGVAYQATAALPRPLLHVSGGTEELLGRSSEELLTDPPTALAALVHPDDQAWLAHQVRKALRGGEMLDLRYRVVGSGGEERWVWDRARIAGQAGGGSVFTGFLMDAESLRLLESRAVSGARRQALGELTGAFAHRFNNLLSAILGPLDLALSATPPEADLHRDLVIAQNAAEQAAHLTNRLRAFSQHQVGRPELVSVSEVVQGLEEMVRELLRPRIRVLVDLSSDTPPVRIDPQQLEQVVVDLVLNARDAMPEGGRLIISTRSRRLGAAELRRDDDLAPGSYAELEVMDTGEGIPTEFRGRVFEPFFSTRPGRVGLGLSTVHGIVRQVGGVVRVGSGSQGGAVVDVLLPAAGLTAGSSSPGRREPSAGRRILVVDDEEAVLEVSVRALLRRGYAARGVPDESSALAVVDEWEGQVDLVVLDVMLGTTTGPRLADVLARRLGSVRVMFTSAFVDDDDLARVGMPEGTVFLAKPFTLKQLVDAVDRALEGTRWEAPRGTGADSELEADAS